MNIVGVKNMNVKGNLKEQLKDIYYAKIKDYILENCSLFDLVRDINSYDGRFTDEYDFYENDEEFFDLFYADKPYELARAINYGEYNFMDDYVYINVYGNLYSTNKYEVEKELEDIIEDITDETIDIYNHLDLDYDLEELIETYEIL